MSIHSGIWTVSRILMPSEHFSPWAVDGDVAPRTSSLRQWCELGRPAGACWGWTLRILLLVPLVGHNPAVLLLGPLLPHHSHLPATSWEGKPCCASLLPMFFALQGSVINSSTGEQLRGRRYLQCNSGEIKCNSGAEPLQWEHPCKSVFPSLPPRPPYSGWRQEQRLH